MNFYKVSFNTQTEDQKELLTALLGEESYDYFDEDGAQLNAYVGEDFYSESILKEIIASFDDLKDLNFTSEVIEHKNWNEEWEKNFSPIIVNDNWSIRATFHEPQNTKNEIVINPKMSFGTGHHATTAMMVALMDEIDFKNQTVFDYGTGTGILAIMASLKKAKSIVGNDIDEWSYENSIDNAALNSISDIGFFKGDINCIVPQQFDIILANINKNVLLESASKIAELSRVGTILLLSGILIADQEDIANCYGQFNFTLQTKCDKDGWMAIVLIKTS